jgi:hypothetical protein
MIESQNLKFFLEMGDRGSKSVILNSTNLTVKEQRVDGSSI